MFVLVSVAGVALASAAEKKKFIPQHPVEARRDLELFRGERVQITVQCEHPARGTSSAWGLSTGEHGTCMTREKNRMSAENQVVAPEWATLIVTTTQIYGKRSLDEKTYWHLPVEKSKQGWRADEPVATPYLRIERAFKTGIVRSQDPVWLGIRPPAEDGSLAVDVLDREGKATVTLTRLARDFETGVAQLSETTLAAFIFDEEGSKVLGVMDRDGRFMAPPLPNVRRFAPSHLYGKPPYFIFAVPLDDKGERFLPLRPDGSVRIEPNPVKAYHTIQPKPFNISAWIKEYDEDGVSLWGWTTPDLATETGPVWRSIVRRVLGVTEPHYLAQLRDGTWMAYRLEAVKLDQGVEAMMPVALLKAPVATAAEIDGPAIIKAHGELQLEILKRPEHNRRVAAGSYRWQMNATDLAAETARDKDNAEQLNKAVHEKNWERAERYARELGGDHWVYFHVGVVNYTHKIRGDSTFWSQLAAQARNESLRTAASEIAKKQAYQEMLVRQEFQRERVRQEGQASLRAAQATAGLKAWLLSGGGMTLPSEAKPSYAERNATTQRYMTEFDRYLRGRQTWKPATPEYLK